MNNNGVSNKEIDLFKIRLNSGGYQKALRKYTQKHIHLEQVKKKLIHICKGTLEEYYKFA